MKNLFLAALTLFAGTSYASDTSHNQLKKLLHFSDDQSRVISSEFFVHPNGMNDLDAEIKASKAWIHSDQGKQFECNFPARFRILTGKTAGETGCEGLNQFRSEFANNKVYIVYVSEFLDSPASAFGHIMVVMGDPEQPIELANAVHFAALTNQESFSEYVYKGLTGGYDGYFLRQPFFEKQFEYNEIEQRAIYLYELDLDLAEISLLVDHLYELRKAKFHYYFTTENCAFQIAALLNAVTDKTVKAKADRMLPIDLVQGSRDSIVNYQYLLPSSFRLTALTDSFTENEQQLFNQVVQGNAQGVSVPEKIREAVAIYYDYLFRRKGIVTSNYKQIYGYEFSTSAQPEVTYNPEQSVKSEKITLSVADSGSYDYKLFYRPFLSDFSSDNFVDHRRSSFSTLYGELWLKDDTVSVGELGVIDVHSIDSRRRLISSPSWAMYLGLNRDREDDQLALDNRLLVGVGWNVSDVLVSTMLGAGYEADENDFSLYLASNSYFFYQQFQLTYQAKVFSDHSYQMLEAKLNHRISDYEVSAFYQDDLRGESTLGLSFSYSFE